MNTVYVHIYSQYKSDMDFIREIVCPYKIPNSYSIEPRADEETDHAVDDEKFCDIIMKFCNNLIVFANYVNSPTLLSMKKIKKQKSRNNNFDMYVDAITMFNHIIYESINILRDILISLYNIFINKRRVDITAFLENLRLFLIYLLNKEVFPKLYDLQITFSNIHNRDINITNRLRSMKGIIFKICNISIDITSMFIPNVEIFKKAIWILEQKTDEIDNERIQQMENSEESIDNIILQLNKIRFNMEVINNDKINNIYACLIDNKSIDVKRILENLEVEYIELIHSTSILKAEIINYNNRRKNILKSFIQKLYS